MRRRSLHAASWALFAFGLLLTGCSLGQVPAAAPIKGPYQVVNVTARNFSWHLSKTNLSLDENVKFVVTSLEGVHGFSIKGTNVSSPVAQGAAPAVVYWHPPQKGTYIVQCNVYCGTGHDAMQTTFTVS